MPEVRERKYWVHVIPPEQCGRKDASGFMVALLPAWYRKNPVHIKPMVFVSERSFATQLGAQREAEYLFGKLEWEATRSDRQIRASFILTSKTPK